MITRVKTALLSTLLFLTVIDFGLAQAPSGTVSFSFDRSTVPLWDLTGTFQFNQQIGTGDQTRVKLNYSIPVTQNIRGILSGSGTILVGVGNDAVAADYIATGRIIGGGNHTKARLTVRLHGDDVLAGIHTRFSIVLNYILTLPSVGDQATATADVEDGVIASINVENPGDLYSSPPDVTITDETGSGASAFAELAEDGSVADIVVTDGGSGYSDPVITLSPPDSIRVSVRGFANFSNIGSGRIESDSLMPLPVDGAWAVYLNIIPFNRLAGTATITLPSGVNLQMSLNGTFSGDTARVRLNGIGSSRGNSLFLQFQVDDGVPASTPDFISGRLLGQAFSTALH